MGSFSDRMKATANRLLIKYGQAIVFVRWATEEYNTETGEVEPVSSTTFSAMCHPGNYTIDEIDGILVQANDINAVVYSTTEPKIDDEATVDNVKYRVMNVEKIKAQGEAIVYRLQLRA
jgi:hypothetical protein